MKTKRQKSKVKRQKSKVIRYASRCSASLVALGGAAAGSAERHPKRREAATASLLTFDFCPLTFDFFLLRSLLPFALFPES
jgi:hypothetical protein